MFKKIKRYIQIAFYSLFYGMRSADKLLSTSNTDNEIDANGIGGIEQQQEQQSVYKDLLNGVVTEQVRQLRHEMYYAERKSREYQYGGGGTAKKTSMFDYQGKQTIGLVLGIDDDFSLLVKVDDKTIKLSSGVVSIRGRKGYL